MRATTDRRTGNGRLAASGVALAICLLASVAAATGAVKPLISGELVVNGGAETGKAGSDSSAIVAPAGWTTTGNFTALKYGASGFPDAAASSAIAGGKQFFAGGPAGSGGKVATATQTVTVPSAFRKAGLKVTAKLSAALGGYSSQLDDASVKATFLSSTGSTLGTLSIKPVSHGQRGNTTKLLSRTRSTSLPTGTTSIQIVVTARPLSGGYVDGYSDNISLHLLSA